MQVLPAEVRPVTLDEEELRVRELPEEGARDAQLSGRPDQQVGIRHPGRVEELAEEVLAELLRLDARLARPPRGLDQLAAAPEAEGEPEVEARALRARGLQRGHAPPAH